MGREPRPSFRGRYFRELPADLPPALVGFLWRMGEVDEHALAGTIVDLAHCGVIEIEPVTTPVNEGAIGAPGDYQLTLRAHGVSALDPIAAKLLSILFVTIGGGQHLRTRSSRAVTVSDIHGFARSDFEKYGIAMTEWADVVRAQAEPLGLFELSSGKAAKAAAVAAAAFAAFGLLCALFTLSAWPLLVLPVSALMYHERRAVRRRTPEGAELYARYRGLRDYLRDFGRLGEKPPEAVVLWQQYLVLATVFGVADEVDGALDIKLPAMRLDPVMHDPEVVWVTGLERPRPVRGD